MQGFNEVNPGERAQQGTSLLRASKKDNWSYTGDFSYLPWNFLTTHFITVSLFHKPAI